jgi:SAM-dependent methyltransferase
MNGSAQTAPSLSNEEILAGRCPACNDLCDKTGVQIPDHEYDLSYIACYAECNGCGTLFQKPMPAMAQLASYYPSDYHSMTNAGLLNRIRNGLRIRRLLRLAKVNGPILDFGCGGGAFLAQATKSIPSRTLWGFEIADCPIIEELNCGLIKIVRGGLTDLLKVLPKCSLITMNHVIEHLPDPRATITSLTERLLPGGVLEGQTPAADSLERMVFGSHWSGYHAPRHTVVFSKVGLATMLEQCGLSSPLTEAAFNPAGIAVSLGSLGHKNGGRIRRSGLRWLSLVAMATLLAPVDLCFGRPGIVNFSACCNRE